MSENTAHGPGPTSEPLGVRVLARALGAIRYGTLTVQWPDGSRRTWGQAGTGPAASIVVVRPRRALARMLYNGATGFAEGYLAGDWETHDIEALLEMAVRNMPQDTLLAGVWFPGEVIDRVRHLLRPNSRAGSKRNIHAHYDLGNDLYEAMLDPTMAYSCALFGDPECGIEDAQRAKWDRLLRLTGAHAGDRVLEIGCGWGGFAAHAAETAGVHVTGVTISREQHDWARGLVAERGLGDLVDIRLQDYRDITGTFDHIVSIEMFEAVGERYWPVFFGTLRRLLEPGGVAALQTITIAPERFDDYRRRADYIQRYVFPGGMLPTPEVFARVAESAGFAVMPPHFFGLDYARTLEEWHARFDEALDGLRARGYDERFERAWRYYLAYCRAGFLNGSIDVMQVALRG